MTAMLSPARNDLTKKEVHYSGVSQYHSLALKVVYQQGLFISERQVLPFVGRERAGSRIRSRAQHHLCLPTPLAMHFRANCASLLLSTLIVWHNY